MWIQEEVGGDEAAVGEEELDGEVEVLDRRRAFMSVSLSVSVSPTYPPRTRARAPAPLHPPPRPTASPRPLPARGRPVPMRRCGRRGRRGRAGGWGGGGGGGAGRGDMGAGAGRGGVRGPGARALDLRPAHEPHRHHGHRPDVLTPARRTRAWDRVLRLPLLHIHVPLRRDLQHGGHLLG